LEARRFGAAHELLLQHAFCPCVLGDDRFAQADVKAQEARSIKQECEEILEEAMPALSAAVAALDTIKAADIRLVQTFKNPPYAVKLVMEAVCVLLEVKPTMVADPNLAGRVCLCAPSSLRCSSP